MRVEEIGLRCIATQSAGPRRRFNSRIEGKLSAQPFKWV